MGYDDYYDADYDYVTDEELYDLVVDQLYGDIDGYYEYMDDDDGDFVRGENIKTEIKWCLFVFF